MSRPNFEIFKAEFIVESLPKPFFSERGGGGLCGLSLHFSPFVSRAGDDTAALWWKPPTPAGGQCAMYREYQNPPHALSHTFCRKIKYSPALSSRERRGKIGSARKILPAIFGKNGMPRLFFFKEQHLPPLRFEIIKSYSVYTIKKSSQISLQPRVGNWGTRETWGASSSSSSTSSHNGHNPSFPRGPPWEIRMLFPLFYSGTTVQQGTQKRRRGRLNCIFRLSLPFRCRTELRDPFLSPQRKTFFVQCKQAAGLFFAWLRESKNLQQAKRA